jgi:hypothetical protein
MNHEEFERARAFLDLEEGRGPVPVLDADAARATLAAARRIAIVGASPSPERPSCTTSTSACRSTLA